MSTIAKYRTNIIAGLTRRGSEREVERGNDPPMSPPPGPSTSQVVSPTLQERRPDPPSHSVQEAPPPPLTTPKKVSPAAETKTPKAKPQGIQPSTPKSFSSPRTPSHRAGKAGEVIVLGGTVGGGGRSRSQDRTGNVSSYELREMQKPTFTGTDDDSIGSRKSTLSVLGCAVNNLAPRGVKFDRTPEPLIVARAVVAKDDAILEETKTAEWSPITPTKVASAKEDTVVHVSASPPRSMNRGGVSFQEETKTEWVSPKSTKETISDVVDDDNVIHLKASPAPPSLANSRDDLELAPRQTHWTPPPAKATSDVIHLNMNMHAKGEAFEESKTQWASPPLPSSPPRLHQQQHHHLLHSHQKQSSANDVIHLNVSPTSVTAKPEAFGSIEESKEMPWAPSSRAAVARPESSNDVIHLNLGGGADVPLLRAIFEESSKQQQLAQEREQQQAMLYRAAKEEALRKSTKKVKQLSDVIQLNVGGRSDIATTRRTLTSIPGSLLAEMFSAGSGGWEDAMERDRDGNIFLDQPSEHFRTMIDILRSRLSEAGDYAEEPLPDYDLSFLRMLTHFGVTLGIYQIAIEPVYVGYSSEIEIQNHPHFMVQTNNFSTFVLKQIDHDLPVQSFTVELKRFTRARIGFVKSHVLDDFKHTSEATSAEDSHILDAFKDHLEESHLTASSKFHRYFAPDHSEIYFDNDDLDEGSIVQCTLHHGPPQEIGMQRQSSSGLINMSASTTTRRRVYPVFSVNGEEIQNDSFAEGLDAAAVPRMGSILNDHFLPCFSVDGCMKITDITYGKNEEWLV